VKFNSFFFSSEPTTPTLMGFCSSLKKVVDCLNVVLLVVFTSIYNCNLLKGNWSSNKKKSETKTKEKEKNTSEVIKFVYFYFLQQINSANQKFVLQKLYYWYYPWRDEIFFASTMIIKRSFPNWQ
jgi:hypothetical protein